MKKTFLLIFLLSIATSQSQIRGNLKLLANQELELSGFNYFKTELLSVTQVDSLGNFTLIYPDSYKGIAILRTKDQSSLVFILTEPGLIINGLDLNITDSSVFGNSEENKVFVAYAKQYQQRQSATSSWYFLKYQYENDSVFRDQKQILNVIKKEMVRIEDEDRAYLNSLDKKLYASWFLPLRKALSEIPALAQYNPEKIPYTIKQFRRIDFNDPKFKTSGLLESLIDGHYMLLEQSGQTRDSISAQMNKSTESILDHLVGNEIVLNAFGNHLLNYLEQKGWSESSDYLTVKLLSQNSCNLEEKLANKLESYRKLKIGDPAPDIIFSDGTALKDFPSLKLLVFGASWCPKCEEELSGLTDYYNDWKQLGMDVVYVSLDTNKNEFINAYQETPWKTDCNFQGWNGKAVKEYHVFATPTYFILDKDLEIVLRPNSIQQINSWLKSKKSEY